MAYSVWHRSVLVLSSAMAVLAVTISTAIGDDGIYVMNFDGGGERKVISVERAATHRSPRFSHDGKRLAFEAIDTNGVRRSYFVNLDGTELKEVAQLGSPDWSPDDQQLALDNDDFTTSAIFIQNVAGGVPIRLCDGAWPRWSPDGKQIAFCDGTLLKVRDLKQETEPQLCDIKFVQRPGSFDWSRDGKRLACFTRTVDNGPRELYIINADGSSKNTKPIYSRPGMVGGHVSWSPDDTQLVFTVDSIIQTFRVDGREEPRMVSNQSDSNRDPSLSPDGKLIAFARRPIVAAALLSPK